MKERSITNRNFLGGFLGGVLGILTCALIYPLLLPVSCFVGVVIGYWYQEIFKALIDSWYETILVWKKRKRALDLKVKSCKLFFTSKRIFLSGMRKRVWFPISSFFSKRRRGLGNFLNVKASPFINWLRAHPMNRAMMFALVSLIVYILVNFIWLVPSFSWLWASIETGAPESEGFVAFLSLMLFIVLLGSFIGSLGPCLFYECLKDYYLDFEVYSNKGILWFMLYQLYRLFLTELVFAFSLILIVLYFVSTGAFFLTFVFVPVAVVLLFLKALYEIAIRRGHFLCLGVTLITTSIFAWQTYPYFNNRAILLTIALATGCFSGALTEVIRRAIACLFNYGKLLEVVKPDVDSGLNVLLAPFCRGVFIRFPSWFLWKKIPSLIVR